jgi:hypothetical protein
MSSPASPAAMPIETSHGCCASVEETVKCHVKTAMAKLCASDRTRVVMIAITRGFLQI